MHAVVGQVKIDTSREDEARKLLQEFAVPSAKALEGFQGGTWARATDADSGHSMLLFDTLEHARAAADTIAAGPPTGAPATVVSVTVCEVTAQV